MEQSESQKKRKKAFKKAKVIFLIVVIAGWLIYRFVAPPITWLAYSLGGELSDYKRTLLVGWVAEEPYAVFPEKESIKSAETYCYHLYSEVFPVFPLLFDNDALAVLSCTYTHAAYETELERLRQLCGNPNEADFNSPAYLYGTEHRGLFLEYALVDEDARSISYFAIQNKSYAQEYLPQEQLPKSWQRAQSKNQPSEATPIDPQEHSHVYQRRSDDASPTAP